MARASYVNMNSMTAASAVDTSMCSWNCVIMDMGAIVMAPFIISINFFRLIILSMISRLLILYKRKPSGQRA